MRSARLYATGLARVSPGNDTLRFEIVGATSNSFGLLFSANNLLPNMGACMPGDGVAAVNLLGLRCVGGGLVRVGTRATDADGSIGISNLGWGAPDNGVNGVLATAGIGTAGVTRHFQCFYRDADTAGCIGMMGLAQQNTTNAVTVMTLP